MHNWRRRIMSLSHRGLLFRERGMGFFTLLGSLWTKTNGPPMEQIITILSHRRRFQCTMGRSVALDFFQNRMSYLWFSFMLTICWWWEAMERQYPKLLWNCLLDFCEHMHGNRDIFRNLRRENRRWWETLSLRKYQQDETVLWHDRL